ncbi:hypothetical protein [Paenibacillus radicis (ex Xue et al. 2023)]|uniref:Uncharacterized protein n=1 Tax=Paenibacillus radicis (ex Xue et al. 2023) TaxID=2972489 RepID=A0ABT1YP45_9BACL|nr:hypothetical protein [Paenibacillus radicis (ex Xue et al. 2023)]MCR8634812.1 hypothetical protein [Paenibacillus radicis (ex Xue et al. 2023)]
MRYFNFSNFGLYRLLAVLVFDIAIILGFYSIFSVLFILAPMKLVIMSLVLFAGLLFLSGAVVFPNLFGRGSIPYPISIVVVSILYLAVSNLISVTFIMGNIVWYICWELFIFAILIGVLSTITYFSNRESEDSTELEKSEKTNINMQLMIIEASLNAKKNNEGILPIIQSFKVLKERINASTPFGRITGNSAVYELENTIRDNLEFIQLHIRSNAIDKNIADIQSLIDETRHLIVNREALNVR